MGFYRTLILRGWWAILLVLAGAAFVLGPYLSELEVEASTDVLLGENDPDLAFYESTRVLWGTDEYAIVCVTRDQWVDAEGVALVKELVLALEAVPHASSVVSILDVPLLHQTPGNTINPLAVKTLASEGVDHDRARAELLGHTQARDNLISADGTSLSILVYLDVPEIQETPDTDETDADGAERTRRRLAMVAGIREIAAAWSARLASPVRLSGIPVISVNIMEHLRHDLRVFGIASLVFFTLAFALVYRNVRFVLLPIITCVLPVVLIVGAMSMLGIEVTVITANLPLLLFTLMLPYTVYFIERYRERRTLHPDEPGDLSTARAAGAIWWPCLFSCTTTMAGFAGLLTSDTQPVHDLGLFMAIGMGAGLIIVFLALPSMSRPLAAMTVTSAGTGSRQGRIVRAFERITLRAPGVAVGLSALLLGLSVWGATRISAQSNFTGYFKSDSEVYLGLEYIDRRMGGTTPLEIQLESDQPGFFVTPPGIAALEAVGAYFDSVPETGNVRSIATLVDELKKRNDKIVPLLPMFARHEMVRAVTREFANDDYTISRVLVRMRETAPTLDRNVVLEGLRSHLGSQPELQGLEVRETGVFLLYANMLNSLVRTQQRTFLYVVLAVFVMLLVLFRSVPLAFLVLISQALPALATLGAMGWLGIPLDLVTVVIASIAMGVGIDAAIQYTFRYRAEFAVDGDPRAAIRRTHATIGRAIWIATSVIISGFLILALSDFRPSIWFGVFTAIAMLISQVAALTTLPSLFLLTGVGARRN